MGLYLPFEVSNITSNVSLNQNQKIHIADIQLYVSNIQLVSTTLLTVIAVFGTLGNMLIIWAFDRPARKGVVSSQLILMLACVDLVACTVCIPETLYFDIWMGRSFDLLCKLQLSIKGFVVPFSMCLLTLIATERFLLICFMPSIKFRKHQLSGALVLIILICSAASIAMSLHSYVKGQDGYRNDVLLNLRQGYTHSRNPLNRNLYHMFHKPDRCEKDYSIMFGQSFWVVRMCVFGLFLFNFTALCILYTTIYLFVLRHESSMARKWIKRKLPNGSLNFSELQSTKPPASESCTKGSSNGMTLQLPEKDVKCVCCNAIDLDRVNRKHRIYIEGTNRSKKYSNRIRHIFGKRVMLPGSRQTSEMGQPKNVTVSHRAPLNDEIEFASEKSNLGLSSKSGLKCFFSRKEFSNNTDRAFATNCRPHVKTAKTLSVVTGTFILSYMPCMLFTAMRLEPAEELLSGSLRGKLVYAAERISFYFFFVNSALNPIIYTFTNRHFQARLRLLRGVIAGRLVNLNTTFTSIFSQG